LRSTKRGGAPSPAFVNARLVRLRFKRDVVDGNLDQDPLRVTQMQCNTLIINLLSFWSWNWKVCWQEGTLNEDFDASRSQIWQVIFTRRSCNPIEPLVICVRPLDHGSCPIHHLNLTIQKQQSPRLLPSISYSTAAIFLTIFLPLCDSIFL